MKFDSFRSLVEFFLDIQFRQAKYLGNIPFDIRDAIYDNEYVNLQGLLTDKLIRELMEPHIEEAFYWILYEWDPITNYTIVYDDTEYIINNIDDYFDMMKKEYKWD